MVFEYILQHVTAYDTQHFPLCPLCHLLFIVTLERTYGIHKAFRGLQRPTQSYKAFWFSVMGFLLNSGRLYWSCWWVPLNRGTKKACFVNVKISLSSVSQNSMHFRGSRWKQITGIQPYSDSAGLDGAWQLAFLTSFLPDDESC